MSHQIFERTLLTPALVSQGHTWFRLCQHQLPPAVQLWTAAGERGAPRFPPGGGRALKQTLYKTNELRRWLGARDAGLERALPWCGTPATPEAQTDQGSSTALVGGPSRRWCRPGPLSPPNPPRKTPLHATLQKSKPRNRHVDLVIVQRLELSSGKETR